MNTLVPQWLDHAAIAARIPHSGPMCLLERVVEWDGEHIVCEATSHTLESNPLRREKLLDAHCAIEYAAQAMAVHGALLSEADRHSSQPTVGYLASVRDVQCHVTTLHDLPSPLRVQAQRITGEATRVLYEFQVHSAARLCVSGRAAVVLDVGLPG
jgi:predicted hotdog family 3-hydroxylacyl-ACP dehydratase